MSAPRHDVRHGDACHLSQAQPGYGRDATDHGAASADDVRGRGGIGVPAQVVP